MAVKVTSAQLRTIQMLTMARTSLVMTRDVIEHLLVADPVGADNNSLQLQALMIDGEIKEIDEERIGILAAGGSIREPTREEVTEIKTLARQVDELIANAQTADTLFKLSIQVVNLANQAQKASKAAKADKTATDPKAPAEKAGGGEAPKAGGKGKNN
jgi:hypothetical protein